MMISNVTNVVSDNRLIIIDWWYNRGELLSSDEKKIQRQSRKILHCDTELENGIGSGKYHDPDVMNQSASGSNSRRAGRLLSSTGMCGGEIKAAIVFLFLWWLQLAVCLSSRQLPVSTDTLLLSQCVIGGPPVTNRALVHLAEKKMSAGAFN